MCMPVVSAGAIDGYLGVQLPRHFLVRKRRGSCICRSSVSNKPSKTSNTISPLGRFSITAHWALAVGTGGAQVGCGGGEKQRAHVGGAFGPKGQREFSLSLGPSLNRCQQSSRTGLGQPQDFVPAVVAVLLDGDQTVPLERQDVPSEGCPVHDHIRGERIGPNRLSLPNIENCVVGSPQLARN